MAKGYLYDNGDELITREDVNEVPDSSSAHAGDVLGLDTNKKPKWTTPESGLPDASEASVGDVLTLDEDKEPVWSAPSGGGGAPVPPSYYCSLGITDENPATYFIYFTDLGQVDSVTIADLYETAIDVDGSKYIYVRNNIDQPGYIGILKESDTYTLWGWFTGVIRDSGNLDFAIFNIGEAQCSGSDTEVNLSTQYVFVTTLTSPR